MATEAELLARLEGDYNHLATKADLANLETRLTKWFAGLLLLVVINVLGTVTGDHDRVAPITEGPRSKRGRRNSRLVDQ